MFWFLIIIFIIFLLKWPQKTALTSSVIIVAVILIFYLINNNNNKENQVFVKNEALKQQQLDKIALEEATQQANVGIKVSYSSKCPQQVPLEVIITNNNSNLTIKSLTFQLNINQKGYSNNLVDSFDQNQIASYRIIAPEEKFVYCVSVPHIDAAKLVLNGNFSWDILEFTINDKNVMFEHNISSDDLEKLGFIPDKIQPNSIHTNAYEPSFKDATEVADPKILKKLNQS